MAGPQQPATDGTGFGFSSEKSNADALKTMILRDQMVSDTVAAQVSSQLYGLCGLTIIDLSRNRITSQGFTSLALALGSNTTLRELNLGGNDLGPLWTDIFPISSPGVSCPLNGVFLNNTTLQKLNLGNCCLEPSGLGLLVDALKYNQGVEVLNVGGNRLGPAAAAKLAELLVSNTTLKHLIMGGNNFGDEGAAALAPGIEANEGLTNLNVWHNHMGPQGVAAIARAVLNHRTMEELRLDVNMMTYPLDALPDQQLTAMEDIAELVQSHRSLKRLGLSHANITNTGATRLADALSRNARILAIDLRGNAIGTDGALALVHIVSVTHLALCNLDLSCNPNIREAVLAPVLAAMQANRRVTIQLDEQGHSAKSFLTHLTIKVLQDMNKKREVQPEEELSSGCADVERSTSWQVSEKSMPALEEDDGSSRRRLSTSMRIQSQDLRQNDPLAGVSAAGGLSLPLSQGYERVVWPWRAGSAGQATAAVAAACEMGRGAPDGVQPRGVRVRDTPLQAGMAKGPIQVKLPPAVYPSQGNGADLHLLHQLQLHDASSSVTSLEPLIDNVHQHPALVTKPPSFESMAGSNSQEASSELLTPQCPPFLFVPSPRLPGGILSPLKTGDYFSAAIEEVWQHGGAPADLALDEFWKEDIDAVPLTPGSVDPFEMFMGPM